MNRGESDEKQPKRAKLEVNKGKHLYLDDVQSIVVDDEVSFDRNIKKLSAEAQKSNPNTEVLNSLMEQTFTNRRMSVLNGQVRVLELVPSFKKAEACKFTLLKN